MKKREYWREKLNETSLQTAFIGPTMSLTRKLVGQLAINLP